MSAFIRISTLFILIFTLNALAQTMRIGLSETPAVEVNEAYQHSISGSFPVYNEQLTPTTVNFRIQWNEENNVVTGIYTDNYYTAGPPAPVSGSVGDQARNLVATLPQVTHNISTINVLVPQPGIINGSVSVTVTPKDTVGVDAGSHNIAALMSTDTTPAPEVNETPQRCVQGFGALTGFCGLYGGTITEVSDTTNRCHTLISSTTKLELATDASFAFYMGYRNSIADLPSHDLGGMQVSPVTTTISHVGRTCTPLAGTSFDSDNCKTLNLAGTFSDLAGTKSFTGTYTIIDDANGDSCTFNISFEQEQVY